MDTNKEREALERTPHEILDKLIKLSGGYGHRYGSVVLEALNRLDKLQAYVESEPARKDSEEVTLGLAQYTKGELKARLKDLATANKWILQQTKDLAAERRKVALLEVIAAKAQKLRHALEIHTVDDTQPNVSSCLTCSRRLTELGIVLTAWQDSKEGEAE